MLSVRGPWWYLAPYTGFDSQRALNPFEINLNLFFLKNVLKCGPVLKSIEFATVLLLFFYILVFWLWGMWILSPWPGIESAPSALEGKVRTKSSSFSQKNWRIRPYGAQTLSSDIWLELGSAPQDGPCSPVRPPPILLSLLLKITYFIGWFL